MNGDRGYEIISALDKIAHSGGRAAETVGDVLAGLKVTVHEAYDLDSYPGKWGYEYKGRTGWHAALRWHRNREGWKGCVA